MKLGRFAVDRVHAVDCAVGLRALPDDCVDVVVTSPPYWGQRSGVGLGGEADPRAYLDALTAILVECLRVLKPEGTLWLNLGDAYNTPINWRTSDRAYSTLGAERLGLGEDNQAYVKPRGRRCACVVPDVPWLRYGNLLALPYRVVLAVCERGGLFRGEIIWHKSRPLPEGRCRRPHRRHESIYLFAKDEGHRFRVAPPVGSVWQLVQTPGRSGHASAFPLELPRRCIEAADPPPGAIVLDPFMGSGTTARAARALGHHFLGFEIAGRATRAAGR